MDGSHRSGCPINLSLEVFGDRWSLIILRDMMFGGRRHFRELLTQSEEGISSNILSDRLKMLLDQGMITKTDDPTHKQKAIYSLTEKAIALVPVFAQLGAWGRRYTPRDRGTEHQGAAPGGRRPGHVGPVHVRTRTRAPGTSESAERPVGRTEAPGRLRRPMCSTSEAQEDVNSSNRCSTSARPPAGYPICRACFS
jgi:DNA-binding HxlR family transcriptional regulator